MYNSVIIGFLMKIWNSLVSCYENSLIKKVSSKIGKTVSKLSKGSMLRNFFSKDLKVIENTLFYKIYSELVDFYNKIIGKINNWFKKIKNSSLVSKVVSPMFENETELLKAFLVFVIAFSIGVIFNSMIRKIFISGSIIASIVLIIMSLIVLRLDDDIYNILRNSWCVNFVVGFFKIDEGGEQWW